MRFKKLALLTALFSSFGLQANAQEEEKETTLNTEAEEKDSKFKIDFSGELRLADKYFIPRGFVGSEEPTIQFTGIASIPLANGTLDLIAWTDFDYDGTNIENDWIFKYSTTLANLSDYHKKLLTPKKKRSVLGTISRKIRKFLKEYKIP